MEKTVALFDLPYQWIFPVIFVVMTGIIGFCFMKYVILADNSSDDTEEPSAPQERTESDQQAEQQTDAQTKETATSVPCDKSELH